MKSPVFLGWFPPKKKSGFWGPAWPQSCWTRLCWSSARWWPSRPGRDGWIILCEVDIGNPGSDWMELPTIYQDPMIQGYVFGDIPIYPPISAWCYESTPLTLLDPGSRIVREWCTQCGPLFAIAKLAKITPMSLWFMILTIVNGVYEPSSIAGGPHCRSYKNGDLWVILGENRLW